MENQEIRKDEPPSVNDGHGGMVMDNQEYNSIVSFIWGLPMIAYVTCTYAANIAMSSCR